MSRLVVAVTVCALFSCSGVAGEHDGGSGGGTTSAGGGTGGGATGGGSATGGGGIEGGGSGGGGEQQDAGPQNDGGPGLDARPVNTTCVAPNPPPSTSAVATQRVFTNLSFSQPLGLFNAPGDTTRVFVQERQGRIRVFPNMAAAMPNQVSTFLDFSTKVDDQGEGGFLGMAFHPQWPTRLEVFVSYTESSAPLRTVVSRFRSINAGMTLDPTSEERVFAIEQPFNNHNGGSISFGPDGFLYIGLGDGGSGDDPLNSGQRLNTNLGKFLRIDVNVPAAQRYAIPSDNPFAGDVACNLSGDDINAPDAGTRCAEIYASGMRNPWRWSFDTVSGELWVADVGQGAYEEVDRVVRGGNYGWKVREGAHCRTGAMCQTAGLIDPVVEYGRSLGNSTTGGYVYRGTTIPSLIGKFVFGDYGSGRIFSVEPDGQGGSQLGNLLDTNIALASFGQLADGEVYALDIGSGQIHQLVPTGTAQPDTFPKLLSQTGCFDSTDPKVVSAALIPYSINVPFWSDGASKERFVAIPDGTTVTVERSGDFTFPNGTVLAKTFTVGGKRIETRLFMRHMNGDWAGYSYEWNDTETEATLLAGSKSKTVGAQTWFYPSRSQCLQCHTAIAGRSLGLELGQLNRDQLYASTGRVADQLETLESIGYFSAALPTTLPKYPEPFGTEPLELRARAWLHSNCAGCHQQGMGQGPADWRYSLAFKDTNSCGANPQSGTLGIANAKLVAPGSPMTSIVSRRIHALDAARMPPVGSSVVDAQGSALVDAWITSLTSCPQ